MLTESSFNAPSVTLNTAEGPRNGPPMLLIHGATDSWQTWAPLLPELTQKWHIFALDLRGHGKSAHTPGDYSIMRFAEDCAAFLRERVHRPAVLVGHSLGGWVALITAALAHDHTRAFVLEDPPLWLRRGKVRGSVREAYFNWVISAKQRANAVDEMAAVLEESRFGRPESMRRAQAEAYHRLDMNFLEMLLDDRMFEGLPEPRLALQAISASGLMLRADPNLGGELADEDIAYIRESLPGVEAVYMERSRHSIHVSMPERMLVEMDQFFSENGINGETARSG